MAYNFDRVPNRRIPGVVNKWTYYPKDPLPLWVADMDFPAPKPILDELRKAVNQGVLGYELASPLLLETVAARMDHLYGWKVQPDAVVPVTGIVSGFNVEFFSASFRLRSVTRKESKGFSVRPQSGKETEFSRASITLNGSAARKLYRPTFSPPITLSNRHALPPSSIL